MPENFSELLTTSCNAIALKIFWSIANQPVGPFVFIQLDFEDSSLTFRALEFCGGVQISAILAFVIFCVSVIGLCSYWAISFPTPPEALQFLLLLVSHFFSWLISQIGDPHAIMTTGSPGQPGYQGPLSSSGLLRMLYAYGAGRCGSSTHW